MDTKLDHRTRVTALAAIRLGIGGTLLVAPQIATWLWIGPGTGGAGTRVLARAIGARDVVLGYRTLRAGLDGDDAASGWLQIGAMADAADVVAGILAYRGIPGHRRFTMPLIAGSVGAACYWVARQGAADASDAADAAAPDGAVSSMSVGSAPSDGPGTEVIDLDELGAVAGATRAGEQDGLHAGDDELDDVAAAALLEVAVDRLDILVADGMLEPVSHAPRRFRRTDLLAARILGG